MKDKLQKEDSFLASFFASIPDGIGVLDNEYRILRVNPAMERWYAHAMPLIGKKCHEVYHGRSEPCEVCPARKTLETGKPSHEVIEKIDVNGEITGWIDLFTFPLKDVDTGKTIGLIEYVRDITKRKKAEDEIKGLRRHNELILNFVTEGIYGVDLEGLTTFVNPAAARMVGWTAQDLIGKHQHELLHHTKADGTPYPTEECPIYKAYDDGQIHYKDDEVFWRKDRTSFPVEYTSTPMHDEQGEIVGAVVVFRDITARKRAKEELQESYERLRGSLEGIATALAITIEMRDPYTAGHQQRVSRLSCAIAQEMGLEEDQIEGIKVTGSLHDIGKIKVPAEILTNPGSHSKLELEMIKVHPEVGYEILKGIEFPWPVAQAIVQHHERLDGTGYPYGLRNSDIILEAKIIGVADVVEAMASHRPYRQALGIEKALEEILKNKGILYDSEVVDVCVKLFSEKSFKFD